MKSTEFLQSAMDVQKERGEQYDKPSGERSMGATVRAFNAITGHALEESDGWMLLGLLKLVRQSQNPEKYHHDSALDFVAYASLYAEAASEQCGQVEEPDPELVPITELSHKWIEWRAGHCPVERGTMIDVKDRDGEVYLAVAALDHYSNTEKYWLHKECSERCEIIAYRVLQQKQ